MNKEYNLCRGLRLFGLGEFFTFLVRDKDGNVFIPMWDDNCVITSFERLHKNKLKQLKSFMIKLPKEMRIKKIKKGDKIIFGQFLVVPYFNNKKLVLPRIVKYRKLKRKMK